MNSVFYIVLEVFFWLLIRNIGSNFEFLIFYSLFAKKEKNMKNKKQKNIKGKKQKKENNIKWKKKVKRIKK